MNILMIEVRAENFFSFCTTVMRDPQNFRDRRNVATHAADLVDQIRQDEAPHVGYLTDVVSELRSFSFRTVEGGTISGVQMIDPVWRGMVHWHAVTNADFGREQTRQELVQVIQRLRNGAELVRHFDRLEHKEAA